KKIVLFGGDDLARCFDDTWVYDCAKRTWSKVETKGAPAARAAHAMVYVPDQKVILLAGGYTGGWRPQKDVWAFATAKGEWTKLSLDLPTPAGHASADFDPKRGLVVMAAYPGTRGNNKIPVLTLKLDLAAAGKAPADPPANPKSVYHCKVSGGGKTGTDLPDEWLAGAAAPEDPAKVRAELKSLPANTWRQMKPPKTVRERNWGWYPYDVRNHRGFAWGGGHSAYAGAEVSEYDVLTNRWRGMADPTNYNPIWLHGMVGGPPGVSFGGWSLLPTHARKSYGVDPLSDHLITYVGDLYSIKHHMFVGNIGVCPGKYGVSSQVAFVTAPHGLYAYSGGLLVRADVKGGRWEEIAKGGPGHDEGCFLIHDSKRDRLLHFRSDGKGCWAFDFGTKAWAEEKPEGKVPPLVLGDGTYVPELDAAVVVFSEAKGAPEKIYFYKCAEKKWYTAPSEGDKFNGVHDNARDWSVHWDGELGLLVRITPSGFAEWMNVHVMRLDTAALKLTPVE
ncbi:MAG TPA: kelch repeat-containing protein, partial [Planctomycetota bacterium]|nr:kelch repeat-containing protein [Planctomycetota bacterium]